MWMPLRGRILPRRSRRSTSPFPGARKDAGPSRRRGRRRSRRRSGRRSQSATRKSPLHPPRFGSTQAMADGRWRRSGGGRPQGSPLRVVPEAATRWAPLTDDPCPVSRGIMPEARRGDFQSPTGRAVSSRPVGPIPDDRRGTPCGCPAGSHRPPAESPLHVVIPGARKDAGPSRRRGRRRSRRRSGRRSQSATGKSPLHPPGSVVPRQWPADGGAVQGEGDHKGRPYESFDSGNAAGAADGQSPPGFSRDHAGGPEGRLPVAHWKGSFSRDHAGGPPVGDF